MKKEIAGMLLDIEAVSLSPGEPFTWSSGLKSPIYCDNRLTLSYPAVRRKIAEGFKEIILREFPGAELIAGTATAGIPHAAWASDLLELPMCYVRSKAKGHGKGNQIEGKITPGQKAVVIEDLISTAGSAINAAEALKEAGCEVLGIASIFTYELKRAEECLREAGMEAVSLTDFSTLSELAGERGLISQKELASLSLWRQNPGEWSSEAEKQRN